MMMKYPQLQMKWMISFTSIQNKRRTKSLTQLNSIAQRKELFLIRKSNLIIMSLKIINELQILIMNQVNKVKQVLQKSQVDKKVFDFSSYALPKSDQIMTRLEFSKFGAIYSQITIAFVDLGGLTNLVFLISVGLSIAFWHFALKNDDLIDQIPNFGILSTDKKKFLLFLLNIIILYMFCGDSIFTYIGIGSLISFLHSLLFVSASTGALIDGQPQEQTNQELTQYLNFSNNNNIELQQK